MILWQHVPFPGWAGNFNSRHCTIGGAVGDGSCIQTHASRQSLSLTLTRKSRVLVLSAASAILLAAALAAVRFIHRNPRPDVSKSQTSEAPVTQPTASPQPHVIFMSTYVDQFTDPETYYDYQIKLVKDQGNVARLFLMIERHLRATRPSQPPVTFDIKSSMSHPAHNGLWINDQEQPLKPGLNVYYFGPIGYGPVDVTSEEVRRITNAEH